MSAARDNRVLHYAVLVSIILHGIALLSASRVNLASKRVEMWPAPIAARLVQPPAAEPATTEPAAPRVAEPPPPPKPKPAPRKPPVAKAAPEPLPSPQAPPSLPPPATEPVQAAPSAAPAPDPSAAPAPQAAAPAARAGTEVDADNIARFRMRVIEEAMKFKRYPRAAQDNNWEGRVDVRVTFGSDGRRASIAIVRSSGYEILDKQALETITKASLPVPPSLRGKEFALEIPVIYNIKDGPSG